MKTITYAEVQQLVTKIPETELPLAYCLLAELAVGEPQSPQEAFMRLSVDERRQVLAQQAEQMKTHYEETAEKKQQINAPNGNQGISLVIEYEPLLT